MWRNYIATGCEARILSSLNHPNICTIHDIGAVADAGHDGRFIVMELLEGESLRSRIHGHSLPIDLVIDVASQIADALDAAHAKGAGHDRRLDQLHVAGAAAWT